MAMTGRRLQSDASSSLKPQACSNIVNPGSWSRDSQPELRRGSRGRLANWRWLRPHPTHVHESLGQSGDVVVQ